MRSIIAWMVVGGVVATTLGGLSASAADKAPTQTKSAAQPQESWRYTYHNAEWWYWLPSNRWVYWRDGQWNAYDPRTFTYAGTGLFAGDGRMARYDTQLGANQVGADSENRPFYGHALSGLEWRTLQPNEEVGPFYGHALPNEFFGSWRSRWANRPFYGHAVSSDGN